MYTKSAPFYDVIYSSKNYEREAHIVHRIIWEHRRSTGKVLLDVGCGTGGHLIFLREHYTVKGLDINPDLLKIALQRCPEGEFFEADMVDFTLGYRVDAIICLFSAIGYVKTVPRLRQAIQTMRRHLKPGGVMIVEPWLTPDTWRPGLPHARFVDEPELKIARLTVSEQEGRISRNDFHYLIATPQGVSHFVERHELGLFTHDEYMTALQDAGLEIIYDPDGLIGRGLYIGLLPL